MLLYTAFSFLCMSVWFLSAFIFPSWLSAFYSNLFGAIGFLMAGAMGMKVILEERKEGETFTFFKNWETKSKQLFLISMFISIGFTILMFFIFSK